MPRLHFENVTVTRGEKAALAGINILIREPRVGVIGLNGSGKSTMVRLINGLILPDEGRVTVDGVDTRKNAREVRKRIGFVFQNPDHQIVYPIVSEDMAFGLRNIGLDKAEIPDRIARTMTRLGISHLCERQTHTLSGGEKQLVALASVLVMAPQVILFDEPTAGLDLRNRNRVRDALSALGEQAVVVTHDLDLLREFDRAIVLDEGRIIMDADPACAIDFYRGRYQ